MQLQIVRQVLTCLVALIHLTTFSMLVYSRQGLAQGNDSDPPRIDFSELSEGIKGDTQVFSATVTDAVGVETVTFYYRFDSEDSYDSVQMSPVGESEIFSASVKTDTIEPFPELIQYYIEAIDSAGNRTLQGFAFDPFERVLITRAPATVAIAEEPLPQAGMSTTRKVVYGVLGLVVVGALASAAGGGSDSSPEPGVDVTVVVDPLP